MLGAISSLGKTTLIHQITDQMAEAGEHIIFFSLEQSRFEMVAKSISRETYKMNSREGRTSLAIMQNTNIDDTTINAVKNYQEVASRYIIREGNFDTTVQTIREYIEQYVAFTGIKPVVVVDYLQILKPMSDKMTDKQAVDLNVTSLKKISRDFNIPLFVISSFNRDNYTNAVSFEAFKESGAIEYSADVVMGLQLSIIEELGNKNTTETREKINEAKNEFPRKIQLVGLKNRSGKSYFKCNFNFYPQFNYFEENDIIPQYAGTTRTVNRSRKSVFGGNTFSNNDDFQLPF